MRLSYALNFIFLLMLSGCLQPPDIDPDLNQCNLLALSDTKIVQYRVSLSYPNGQQLQRDGATKIIKPGEEFEATVTVDDLRTDVGAAGGVFAAFADLVHNSPDVSWKPGSLVIGRDFPNAQAGEIDNNNRMINEAGGGAGIAPLGADPARILFRVRGIVASTAVPGTLIDVALNAAEPIQGDHDTLVRGIRGAVPAGYGRDSMRIETDAPKLINVRFAITDAEGIEVTSLQLDQDFYFEVYVKDLRTTPAGVASAFVDVLYESELASVRGPIEHGPEYNGIKSGSSSTPGILDEVGSGATNFPSPNNPAQEHLLFKVPMRAISIGLLEFRADPPEAVGSIFLLAYYLDRIPFERVRFENRSILIKEETADCLGWLPQSN